MRVEKEQHNVVIICSDGVVFKGFVHINPGERMLDFVNDEKRKFIPVTNVEFVKRSFRLIKGFIPRTGKTIILNRSSIKFIEEI
ncbi:MAG: hypothetical protein KJ880_07525 [Candidatus Omnitrophica bacterium]|nr:hypothetical protein [Candidatus Omnitrophota bacterium]MBU1869421.1 hypothetical protein [Candidatus Omnitrophota bacterium]